MPARVVEAQFCALCQVDLHRLRHGNGRESSGSVSGMLCCQSVRMIVDCGPLQAAKVRRSVSESNVVQ